MSSLYTYLRSKAKNSGGKVLESEAYYPGSVIVIQRFGSALNLNVLIHSQVSDGVYIRLPGDRLIFLRVPPPKDEEINKLTVKIARRIHRYL